MVMAPPTPSAINSAVLTFLSASLPSFAFFLSLPLLLPLPLLLLRVVVVLVRPRRQRGAARRMVRVMLVMEWASEFDVLEEEDFTEEAQLEVVVFAIFLVDGL